MRTSARRPREGEGSRAAGSPVLHLHVRGSMTLLLEGVGGGTMAVWVVAERSGSTARLCFVFAVSAHLAI